MRLLAVYVLFVILGEGITYAIGRIVESFSMAAGLPVFLVSFFVVFWAAWKLAIRVA